MKAQASRMMRERMMERSELRIGSAARSGDGHAAMAASRVMESALAWNDWSGAHLRLLDAIVAERRSPDQVSAVRRMAISMIHRKASFEFLRDRGIRGPDRQRFFDATYGRNTHGRAIVLEHRHFVRAMCSFICVEDLCGPGSLQQIREYERIYNRYWFARAAVHMGGAGAQGLVRTAGVLDELRRKAVIARQRLLAVAPSSEDVLTLAELRQPTGDTLRLPALRLRRDRA